MHVYKPIYAYIRVNVRIGHAGRCLGCQELGHLKRTAQKRAQMC